MHIYGYLVNTATVIVGSLLGLLLGSRLPEKIKKIILSGLGLSTLLIGMSMALETNKLILIVGSLILGGIIGEIIGVEEWLERLGERLKIRVGSSSRTFVLGFVTASLLFCTGPMTIVGSLEDGFAQKADLIYIKSLLDAVAAIALSATMGIGVIFSAITVFVLQGILTYAGFFMGEFVNELILNEISAVGGILILGIGLNMLEVVKIRIGSLLPALLIAAILAYIFL